MKKNIKYIMLMLLLLLPTSVLADTGNNSSCTTTDSSRMGIRVKVGETIDIPCNGALSSTEVSCREESGNNSNFCLPKSGISHDYTANFEQVSYNSNGIFGTGVYTFRALNIGQNDFFCDHGVNKCYNIIVTDEQGRTYNEIIEESLPEDEPTVSLPMSEARSGYGCYLMCQNGPCNRLFLFYTNRDLSGVSSFSGGQAKTDLFAPGTDGRNVQSLLQENGGHALGAADWLVSNSGFASYTPGSAMSPMQCAAAGIVLNSYGSSEPYDLVIEESSGTPHVYEPLDNLLLFGNGFTTINIAEEGVNTSNPYDPNESSAVTWRNREPQNGEARILTNTCPVQDPSQISNNEDFLRCYGFVYTGRVDYVHDCDNEEIWVGIQLINASTTCTSNLYTIGVVPEPDNATNAVDDATDPNNLIDGHVIGGGGAETTEFVWTCEDVKYTTFAFTTLRFLAPFLLIIFGSLDFLKAVYAGDVKKQQEARSKFPRRIIAFLLLIILPFVVGFIFKNLGRYRSNTMTAFCCVATNGNPECTRYNDVTDDTDNNTTNNQ